MKIYILAKTTIILKNNRDPRYFTDIDKSAMSIIDIFQCPILAKQATFKDMLETHYVKDKLHGDWLDFLHNKDETAFSYKPFFDEDYTTIEYNIIEKELSFLQPIPQEG